MDPIISTKPKIADIQTSNLLYYDPDFKDLYFRFCQKRDIDCLPSLTDPSKLLLKTEAGFEEQDVSPGRKLDGDTPLFAPDLLERFRGCPLLFVYNKYELTGVVHFADYNRPAVSVYLFDLLSRYERSLRRLLALHGLKNQDMLAYFQSFDNPAETKRTRNHFARALSEYERNKERNAKLPEFECFYLKNLMELAQYHKVIDLSPEVNDLRNKIMHAGDPVSLHDAGRGDLIYTLDSFQTFFNQASLLIQDSRKVRNKIALLEGGE